MHLEKSFRNSVKYLTKNSDDELHETNHSSHGVADDEHHSDGH